MRYVAVFVQCAFRVLDTETGEIIGPWCLTLAAAQVEAMRRNAVDAANKTAIVGWP